jgi:hypothetical protein
MCKVIVIVYVSEDRCMHEYVRAGCRLVDCPKDFVSLWLTNNKKPCYDCCYARSCRIVVK